MATCQHCGAFVALPFKCNYCGLELCPNCRLPFNHDCAGMGSWKVRFIPPVFETADTRRHEPGEYMPPRTQAAYDEEADHRFYPRYEEDEDKSPPKYLLPSEHVSIRRRLQRAYREITYSAWRFWRYVRKNWFWVVAILIGGYVLLVNPALIL